MHYYQFNIGDYLSHTKHLTPIEDICYRRLLDFYYLHEKPISNDVSKITRLLMLNGHSTDVERVLNEFFVLVDNEWFNNRADAEIVTFHSKKEQASMAGKASAAKRSRAIQRPLNDRSIPVELNINHKTIYIPPIPFPLFNDYSKIRKAKKAGALTETAFNQIEKEAAKVNLSAIQAIEICCKRAWVGFEKSWLTESDLPAKVRGLQA